MLALGLSVLFGAAMAGAGQDALHQTDAVTANVHGRNALKTQDAAGLNETTAENTVTVTIQKDIYTIMQDPVTETVPSGTTLGELTSTALYGWEIQNYKIGEDYVDASTAITADTEVTVIYIETDGTMGYTIDFYNYTSEAVAENFYAHIWRNESAAGAGDGASSDIKLPITEPPNRVTVRVPADATAFFVSDSPDSSSRTWRTVDIVATGLLYDAYRITGIDETQTGITHYYGKWDSNVDAFVAYFFSQTAICVADGSTGTAALVEAWGNIETEWGYLELAQKGNIEAGTPDPSAAAVGTINGMLARYDHIVGKYYGTVEGITDFMNRAPSAGQVSFAGLGGGNGNALLTIASVLGGTLLLGLSIVAVRRKRKPRN